MKSTFNAWRAEPHENRSDLIRVFQNKHDTDKGGFISNVSIQTQVWNDAFINTEHLSSSLKMSPG